MIDVVIAGAGPTGLTLAIDLARRGIRCRVLDQAPQPPPGSRGVTLKPRSLEVLDDLGVADRVLAGSHVESRSFRQFPGAEPVFGQVPPEVATPARPYPNSVAIPQFRTREILRDRFAELGGAVEFGRRITGVRNETDCVRVETEDGEVIEARYLVGADGGRSTVRGAIGVAFEGSTQTERAMLTDVHVSGLRREDGVHLWFAANGHMVAARPLAHSELWQVVGSVQGTADVEVDLPAVQAIVTERTGREDIRLTDPAWLSLWRYNLRIAEHYRSGRVFLAGDAAHVHSPFGGHGMNTGIQDAYNLGWKLALVLQGIADETLLDTYEGERLPVGEAILADSHRRITNRSAPDGKRPLHDARDDHPTYPDSPLTRGCAGELAAEALPELDGLLDLLRGPHFTVLRFGDVAVPDLGPHVHLHAVESTVPRLVLVRPDGYVGYVGDDLSAYLREIGLDLRAGSRV